VNGVVQSDESGNDTSETAIMNAKLLTAAAALVAIVLAVNGQADQPKEPKKPTLYDQAQAHYHLTAGMYLSSQKNRAGAIDEYTKAIQKVPSLAWAYHRRGTLYSLQRDNAKALADLKQVVELDGSIIYAHYNRACILAQEKKVPEALVSLETAIRKGYRKLSSLENDADLASVREEASFKDLGTLLKKLNESEKLTDSQRFQTADPEGRAKLVSEHIDKPVKDSLELANLAIQDHVLEIRMLGVQLLADIKTAESRRLLVKALYDANGYIKKAAANTFIAAGKDSEALVLPILETKDDHAILYAVQIIGRIGGKEAGMKLVPLLKHEDAFIRTQTAVALGRLKAVDALPKLEEMLKSLKDSKEGETLKIEVQRVVDELRAIKEKSKM
jgi:tetratricopeptide (TPR) repeat protein